MHKWMHLSLTCSIYLLHILQGVRCTVVIHVKLKCTGGEKVMIHLEDINGGFCGSWVRKDHSLTVNCCTITTLGCVPGRMLGHKTTRPWRLTKHPTRLHALSLCFSVIQDATELHFSDSVKKYLSTPLWHFLFHTITNRIFLVEYIWSYFSDKTEQHRHKHNYFLCNLFLEMVSIKDNCQKNWPILSLAPSPVQKPHYSTLGWFGLRRSL